MRHILLLSVISVIIWGCKPSGGSSKTPASSAPGKASPAVSKSVPVGDSAESSGAKTNKADSKKDTHASSGASLEGVPRDVQSFLPSNYSVTPTSSLAKAKEPSIPLKDALDLIRQTRPRWYGMYLMGRKVGYMKEDWSITDGKVVYTSLNSLKVRVLGGTKDASVTIKITYEAQGQGRFISMKAEERLPGLTKTVTLVRSKDGDGFEFTQTLSGPSLGTPRTTRQIFKGRISPLTSSSLAIQWLIAHNQISREGWVVHTFDYQQQRFSREGYFVRHTVERIISGIKTRLHVVDYLSEAQGLSMVTLFSADGVMLVGSVGGRIELKLEGEKAARDISVRFDMGFGTMIPLSLKSDPRKLDYLELSVTGPMPRDIKFLNTHRYSLTSKGKDLWLLKLRKDELNGLSLPARLPAEVVKYTRPSPGIESDDPELVKFARTHAGSGDALSKVRRLTMFVGDYVQDSLTSEYSSAIAVMKAHKGDCSEHALLLTALLRAVGIPARMVAGVGYVGGAAKSLGYHAWVQVYLGRWIDVDPTWKQVPADVTHILLGTPDRLEWLSSVGNLTMVVVKEGQGSEEDTHNRDAITQGDKK